MANFVGERLESGKTLQFLGETFLRLPAKLAGWYCGTYEYSRHNCIEELGIALHSLRHKSSIYHFLYGEKNYRFSGCLNGFRGNKYVASFHHVPSRLNHYLIYKNHLKYLEHAVAMSSNQIEFLERWVGPGRVTVIPHGVDTEYWHPKTTSALRETVHCVFAGQHLRDFETLESIVQQIARLGMKIEFVLLCANDRCKSIADLSNVQVVQRCSDSDYRAIMQNADLLVLPLKDSTAVNSVLEALACGVPVITNSGGISDYLSEKCSYQFDVGDARGMIDAIVHLATVPTELRAMKENARSQALEYSWPRIAKRMSELYLQLVPA